MISCNFIKYVNCIFFFWTQSGLESSYPPPVVNCIVVVPHILLLWSDLDQSLFSSPSHWYPTSTLDAWHHLSFGSYWYWDIIVVDSSFKFYYKLSYQFRREWQSTQMLINSISSSSQNIHEKHQSGSLFLDKVIHNYGYIKTL